MLPVLFAILCVSMTAGRDTITLVVDDDLLFVNGEEETLKWPDMYTVKARRLSLTANFVEDLIFWRTNVSTRLDSNHGAVKTFTNINVVEKNDTKYEIHPKTDADENIKIVCNKLVAGAGIHLELDNILPEVSYKHYKAIRNESVAEHDAVRFEYTAHYSYIDMVHVLWAVDDDYLSEENIWVPVRYEVKEYNNKLGSLTKHEIWDFYNFEIYFDESEVFDLTPYGCHEDRMVKVTPNSDAVTKELMFVNPEKKHHVDHVFNSFKHKFNRKYAHDEHSLRRSIFKQNMRLISSTNRQHLSYKLGVNQFADRTPEELKKRTGLLRRPQGKSGNMPFPYTEETLKDLIEQLPNEVDLRLNGLITPVHDQLDCGSCWTYGTTSAVEGALARQNGGRLIRLSNQALIDCAWAFGAAGCYGGSDVAAYEWMMKYGLPTEEEYGSYESKDGYCHIKNMTTKYQIKGYTDVTPFSEGALKVALFSHGPLAVSVEATTRFKLYSSGIFYEEGCGPGGLNHEVTLVGYGQENGELFWILKNSYGVNWGIDGYMLISARNNDCGVATKPTYIVL